MNELHKGRLNPDIRISDGLSKIKSLGFFDELRFQVHRAAINFTTNIVVALLQADAFDFGALLDDHGAAFDFEVFNQDDSVAVLQHGTVGIFDAQGFFGGFAIVFRPFKRAFGTDVLAAVFVGVFGLALRARWEGHGGDSFG